MIKVTPDIAVGTNLIYLIRIDTEPYVYMTNAEEAKETMSLLALELAKEETNTTKGIHILREDFPEKDIIVLRKRTIGTLYNSIEKCHVLDIWTVSNALRTKVSLPIPIPPTPPQKKPNMMYCYSS